MWAHVLRKGSWARQTGCFDILPSLWFLQSLFSSCILRRLFSPETVVPHCKGMQSYCAGSGWNLAILASDLVQMRFGVLHCDLNNPCSTTSGLQDLKGFFNLNDFVILQVVAGDLSILFLLREARWQEGKSQKFWLGSWLSFLSPAFCWHEDEE